MGVCMYGGFFFPQGRNVSVKVSTWVVGAVAAPSLPRS